MYTLDDIWNDIFRELMQANNGILAYRSSEKQYTVLRSAEKLYVEDKIEILIGHDLMGQYRDNRNVGAQFLEGKFSVRKQGCAAFTEVLKRLYSSLVKSSVEEQTGTGGQRIKEIMENSAKAGLYLQSNPEKWNFSVLEAAQVDRISSDYVKARLIDLEIEAFETMRDHYFDRLIRQELLAAEPQMPDFTAAEGDMVWDYLAFLISTSFLYMDFSEAKRGWNDIEKRVERLKEVLKKCGCGIKEEAMSPGGKPELKTYLDLIKMGRSALDICKELVENDDALYQLGIDHKNEGNPELWAQFLEACPETFLFMVYNEKIVGNYSLVTLSAEQVAQLERGKLYEADFSVGKNTMIFSEGLYTLYILNYSVNLGFSTRENRVMLWDALLKQLEQYAEQSVYFDKVYVNIFRTDHEELYKQLGFEFVRVNESQGRIYCLKNFPEDLKWSHKKRLMDLYEKRPK